MIRVSCLSALAAVLCFAFGGSVPTDLRADSRADPRGIWLTPGGQSRVEIATCGSRLCGKIVWLKEPNNAQGQPLRDARNKDESLRSRPILGLPLLTGLPIEAADGKWKDGDVYSPRKGKTYRAELELDGPDTLKVRACTWLGCRTQIWKRVK